MQENLIVGPIWCNSKDTDQTRLSVQADPTCAFAVSMQQSFLTFKFFGELSGRVLDSRLKGRVFEPHRPHCVVVLKQDTFILA